jgi:hypothetical protein
VTTSPDSDVAAAHRFFAAHCFNHAWELIEKPDGLPEEDRLMVALNQASIFHWLNRPDWPISPPPQRRLKRLPLHQFPDLRLVLLQFAADFGEDGNGLL